MEQVWYIKLHRKTLESEIWHKPAAWFKIWSYILMEVNFKENWLPEWSKYMSYEWIRLGCPGVSWGQIDKFFRWSKSVDSLSTSKSTRWMVVSVANYSQYQCIEKTPKSIAKSMTGRWPVDTIIEEGKKKEDNTNVLSAFREVSDKDSYEPYKYFLWSFLNLWWIPWKSDTVENMQEWMRETLHNWWVLTGSDAKQVMREFYAYWNTKRDDPWYSKKNWKTTLVNSPSLPHNKTKYAIKK